MALSKQDQAKEFLKCASDVQYFFKTYVLVPIPGLGELTTLKLYDSQTKYINTLQKIWKLKTKDGVILLASRQCGKTVMTEALIVHTMIFNSHYDVLFMSRDLTQGKETVAEIKAIINRLPNWLRPKYTKNQSYNFSLSNGSSLTLQASNKSRDNTSAKGRGTRPTLIWIDEAAFIHLEDHLKAVLNASAFTFKVARENNLPYGVILSSTPNGRTGTGEKFYKLWSESNIDPERSAYLPVKIHWSEIPGYDDAWYEKQRAINSYDERTMNQEYELLFVGSSESIFDDEIIKILQDEKTAQEPIQEKLFPEGYIRWFDIPDNNSRYIVGIDTATADGSDYSSVEVICYDTGEQIVEGMFKCTVTMFCEKYIPQIIDILPNKVLAIESNSVGNQTIEMLKPKYERIIVKDELAKANKSKLGITMSNITRPLLIEQIYELFSKNSHVVKSKTARLQATSLVRKNSGRIEGQPNDDLVFGLGLAYLVSNHYNLINYFNISNNDEEDDIFDTFDITGERQNINNNFAQSDVLNSMFSDESMEALDEYRQYKKNKFQNKYRKEKEIDNLGNHIV
jgi:hypothetical protein